MVSDGRSYRCARAASQPASGADAKDLLGTIGRPMTDQLPIPLRDQVRAAIARAWDRGVGSGALPHDPEAGAGAIAVDRPSNPEHGDFATNLALRLAKPLR